MSRRHEVLAEDRSPQDRMASSAPGTCNVARRQVFFIPGYDPIPPRRYRELYRREGAAQSAISGYEIALSAGPSGEGSYAWSVEAEVKGQRTASTITFLTWDDIVKRSMNRTILSSYLVMFKTVWIYFASGAFIRLVRVRPQPMLAALYPVVMLLAQLEIALLALWGVMWLLTIFGPLPLWIGAISGLAAMTALMIFFFRKDRYVFAYYLINDYGFTAQNRGRYPAPLRARISQFAAQIAEAMQSDVDEVLVVGHSSGAHVAVTALAEALRQSAPAGDKAVSFLTLGQVIPMMSFLPQAQELRADLNQLSRTKEVAWIDISAPGDGGCFALSDPVHVTGVAPPEADKHWPKVISAAYSRTLSPQTLARTKWRFFRRHIQYLCAFERPESYDYFLITAGPKTLKARFDWRGATASRKETVLSGYRDF